jgi:PBCV-specific basic adaptor domain
MNTPKYRVNLTINLPTKTFTTNSDNDFILEDLNNYTQNETLNKDDIKWYLKSSQQGEMYRHMIGITEDDVDNITINSIKSIQSGGKHKSKNHKRRTPEKVEINKKVKAVFVGPKGGKYVRKNGKYVPLKKLI